MEGPGNNIKNLADLHYDNLQNDTSPNVKTDHVFIPPKPVTNEKQEKYDLNKCDFDLLVAKVGEKDFVQNLRNIFQFLTSDVDEQEFRDVSKDMEEILVRIVKDVDVLKSDNIYGKGYCEKIIEILSHTTKSKIFKLVCFFKKEAQEQLLQGLGVECKNILMYKKLYQLPIPEELRQGFPSMSSLASSPPVSRSASTDSLISQRSSIHITPPAQDHFIPHCFQLITNFVKDTTQQTLEFHGLSAEDAKLLHSSFSCIIAGDARGKTVCGKLWDYVKTFSSRFEFKIDYIKPQSLDTKSLLLEKQFRTNPSCSTESLLLEKQSRTNPSCSTDTYYNRGPKSTKRKEKQMLRQTKLINNLNFDFVTQILETIVDFLSDEAQGSLVAEYTNEHEKKFMKTILDWGRSENIQAYLDIQHRRLFTEIITLTDCANFRMKISASPKSKGGRKHEVIFIKIPRTDGPQQKRVRSIEPPSFNKPPRLEDPNHQMGRPWYPQLETTPNHPMGGFVLKPVHTDASQQAGHFTATNFGASTSQAAVVPTTAFTNKDITSKVPNISFQTGGLMTQMTCSKDPALIDAMKKHETPENNLEALKPKESKLMSQALNIKRAKPQNNNKPLKKDQQLMEALSVPVRSEKALKMMMGMGWTGGALGTRGDGITEPIMPHLRNDSCAGLGHKGTQIAPKRTKPTPVAVPNPLPVPNPVAVPIHIAQPLPSYVNPNLSTLVLPSHYEPPKRTAYRFRKIFLGGILELLNSEESSKTLEFNPTLHKKEKTFARHAIRTFAARTKFTIAVDEQIMVDKVAEHYNNDRELAVTACISDNGRQIVLNKQRIPNLNQITTLDKLDLKLNENPKIAIYQLLNVLGPICQTDKALESTKFRLEILIEILNFIKDENNKQTTILLQKRLTPKQKNYLWQCVSSVNKRARFGVTTPEVAVSIEIKKYIGTYHVGIDYTKDLKTITVTKGEKSKLSQASNLDSTGDIDYFTSDDDIDATDNEKRDEKNIPNENKSDINDAAEANHKMEVTNENNGEANTNNDLKSPAVNEPDSVNISELVEAIKEADNDKEINTEVNIPEFDSSVGDAIGNSYDDITMSENSGFTENLDYNETDVNMSDDGTISDKQINDIIDLSNISTSTLNVENDSKIKDVFCIIVYLSKECDDAKDMPKYIQGLISHNIMETKKGKTLPLLKCHGVHDNFLIYSCHSRNSYAWLHDMCVANKITICTKVFDKMSLKVNTLIDFDEKYIFNLLEMYNENISTKEWSVLKKENLGDTVIFDVKMDKRSVKSVMESNFEMYAGVDKVTFIFIWE